MINYEIGDKVWSVSFPIIISHCIEYKEQDKYWVGINCPVFTGNDLFFSKNDAIDGMIKKLQEMKE